MVTFEEIDEPIQVVDFDATWPLIYQAEAEQLKKKLANQLIALEHIGSTAIPGIAAKPIIDIMLGVEKLTPSSPILNQLITMDYQFLGEANVKGRYYLRKRQQHNFNIAICQYQGEIWNNNLLFRNYLLNHPDLALAYGALKKEAFLKGATTLLKYSAIKCNFIERILIKAQQGS